MVDREAAGTRSFDVAGAVTVTAGLVAEGYQAGFLGGAALAVLGALLTVFLLSSRESREHAEAARGEGEAAGATA